MCQVETTEEPKNFFSGRAFQSRGEIEAYPGGCPAFIWNPNGTPSLGVCHCFGLFILDMETGLDSTEAKGHVMASSCGSGGALVWFLSRGNPFQVGPKRKPAIWGQYLDFWRVGCAGGYIFPREWGLYFETLVGHDHETPTCRERHLPSTRSGNRRQSPGAPAGLVGVKWFVIQCRQ